MDGVLAHPAIQAGVAPFLAALIVATVLTPVRLGGWAVIAAFVLCVALVSGLQFTPLTATRKILVLAIAAAALGPMLDYVLKPTRAGIVLIGLVAAGATLWAFWPVILQRAGSQAWFLGGTAAIVVAVAVGFSQAQLTGDGVRAGAAVLALGLGVGIASIFAASLSYGLYGLSLAAGGGGYLLPQMVRGRKAVAGATLTLPAMLAGSLVGVGAMLLAQLPWYCVPLLALIPVAVCLPGPARAPVWLQAVVFSLYGFVIAGVACALAWPLPQT